jgi:hypothetical protein
MRPFSHIPTRHARRGRVLVECCVSLVLLAGGSALVLLMSSTTARFVDDARQQDLLQRETASQMTDVASAPCTVSSGASVLQLGPRAALSITSRAAGSVRARFVDGSWQPSSLASRAMRRHQVGSAGWCE